MFRHVFKTTSLKFTNFMSSTDYPIESKKIQTGLLDLKAGIDALLEDQWKESQRIFQNPQDPFHAFGQALLAYIEFVLSLEYQATYETIIEHSIEVLSRHSSQHHELLKAHATFMLSSLQFLRSGWVEHLKAACEMRRAYKIYERLFEDTLGVSIADYDLSRPAQDDDSLEHGIYFGLGLFYLVFSLLPTKAVKILGHFKFRSVQYTSIHLLKKAGGSKTLYAPLGSLVLLYYYANRSMYLSPDASQSLWILDTLGHLKLDYPSSPLVQLLEAKMTRNPENLKQCLAQLFKVKRIDYQMNENGCIQSSSIKEHAQFKLLVLFEIGWLHVFLGHYAEATEIFFCLESTCPWSRLFYHFLSTCCMMADGLFEKASREINQLLRMFEAKRKWGAILSASEEFAECKVRRWTREAKVRRMLVGDLLKEKHPVLWELVYLRNGVACWSTSLMDKIKQQLVTRHTPFARLLLGVILRDREEDEMLALAYFESIVDGPWAPCAMYEIALTYSRTCSKTVATSWLKRVECYYTNTSSDNEWKMCMKTKCQLLLESLEVK